MGDAFEMYQPHTLSQAEIDSNGSYKVYGANGVIGKHTEFNHEDSQVLITCRGATCGTINVSEPKSWINGNAMVIKPRSNDIDKNFLKHYLLGGVDLRKSITGAAQPQITRQSLNPIQISIPPLAEQKRIAELLDTADRVMRFREQAISKLDQLAESVFVDMFGEIKTTSKYTRKKICLVSNVQTGKTPPTSDKENYAEDVPFVTPTDLRGIIKTSTRYVSNKGASLIKTVRQGSCLVGCIGDIGRVGYVTMPVTFNQQINAIEWNNELVDDIFGYYAIKYMEDVLKASSVSAVVPILNKTNFSNITIPIPPLSEQKRFAIFVNNVWKIEAAMKNNTGENLISSLQHQSFAAN